jgi:acyl-CoA thioester hydrolase
MEKFHFYHPIEVRYGDIDAQRHVNNACYFTYMEAARIKYVQHLGLWNGADFDAIGIILLEICCTFKKPIVYGQSIRVGVKMVRMGNKSLELLHSLEDAHTGEEMATGKAIVVAYDYKRACSITIPPLWRETIEAFEGNG